MLNFNGDIIYLKKEKYAIDGSLAIQAYCEDGSPFASITVKISESPTNNCCAFVDANNLGEKIITFIENNNLGEFTGKFGLSGFCVYPECEFNLEEVKKHWFY